MNLLREPMSVGQTCVQTPVNSRQFIRDRQITKTESAFKHKQRKAIKLKDKDEEVGRYISN